MITVIGDLTVDILVQKAETNIGTDTGGKINCRPGGQANNVASFISREGVSCRLIGKVGNDLFGNYLIEESKRQGVTPVVTKEDKDKTGSIVLMIDNDTGERSMITDRGANLFLSEKDIQGLDSSELIYLSGYSFFSESTQKAVRKAKEMAFAADIPVALDPSSTYFLKDHKDALLKFLEGVTFFFPNYEEGVLLTGEENPRNILLKLKQLVAIPILKLGEKGCLFFYDGDFVELSPPEVEVVDTTAAGDSFAGSFLANYLKTDNILQSAERAVEVSSHTCTYVGALPG
ncbi:carbohydrate kinase family protein [Salipaludibacillus aurantiacus]|uniref:Ribokinase n=1 Tax=Salipaludibacillus aurantiacus TaxID=1601833 RepID=A0A1H9UCA5_9BACI|nr:carbohydrate kinase family protein [Salipaludibacillus aurantiacus]SES06989.1 ribokinase [Salipaludibacillus aurantiacus]